jgi:hypothetical protein
LQSSIICQIGPSWISGETVEKAPKQILGGDPEKNDFTECATIDDLTLMKGRETPPNQALTELKGFSTVSEGILGNGYADITYESPKEVCFRSRGLRIEIIHVR